MLYDEVYALRRKYASTKALARGGGSQAGAGANNSSRPTFSSPQRALKRLADRGKQKVASPMRQQRPALKQLSLNRERRAAASPLSERKTQRRTDLSPDDESGSDEDDDAPDMLHFNLDAHDDAQAGEEKRHNAHGPGRRSQHNVDSLISRWRENVDQVQEPVSPSARLRYVFSTWRNQTLPLSKLSFATTQKGAALPIAPTLNSTRIKLGSNGGGQLASKRQHGHGTPVVLACAQLASACAAFSRRHTLHAVFTWLRVDALANSKKAWLSLKNAEFENIHRDYHGREAKLCAQVDDLCEQLASRSDDLRLAAELDVDRQVSVLKQEHSAELADSEAALSSAVQKGQALSASLQEAQDRLDQSEDELKIAQAATSRSEQSVAAESQRHSALERHFEDVHKQAEEDKSRLENKLTKLQAGMADEQKWLMQNNNPDLNQMGTKEEWDVELALKEQEWNMRQAESEQIAAGKLADQETCVSNLEKELSSLKEAGKALEESLRSELARQSSESEAVRSKDRCNIRNLEAELHSMADAAQKQNSEVALMWLKQKQDVDIAAVQLAVSEHRNHIKGLCDSIFSRTETGSESSENASFEDQLSACTGTVKQLNETAELMQAKIAQNAEVIKSLSADLSASGMSLSKALKRASTSETAYEGLLGEVEQLRGRLHNTGSPSSVHRRQLEESNQQLHRLAAELRVLTLSRDDARNDKEASVAELKREMDVTLDQVSRRYHIELDEVTTRHEVQKRDLEAKVKDAARERRSLEEEVESHVQNSEHAQVEMDVLFYCTTVHHATAMARQGVLRIGFVSLCAGGGVLSREHIPPIDLASVSCQTALARGESHTCPSTKHVSVQVETMAALHEAASQTLPADNCVPVFDSSSNDSLRTLGRMSRYCFGRAMSWAISRWYRQELVGQLSLQQLRTDAMSTRYEEATQSATIAADRVTMIQHFTMQLFVSQSARATAFRDLQHDSMSVTESLDTLTSSAAAARLFTNRALSDVQGCEKHLDHIKAALAKFSDAQKSEADAMDESNASNASFCSTGESSMVEKAVLFQDIAALQSQLDNSDAEREQWEQRANSILTDSHQKTQYLVQVLGSHCIGAALQRWVGTTLRSSFSSFVCGLVNLQSLHEDQSNTPDSQEQVVELGTNTLARLRAGRIVSDRKHCMAVMQQLHQREICFTFVKMSQHAEFINRCGLVDAMEKLKAWAQWMAVSARLDQVRVELSAVCVHADAEAARAESEAHGGAAARRVAERTWCLLLAAHFKAHFRLVLRKAIIKLSAGPGSFEIEDHSNLASFDLEMTTPRSVAEPDTSETDFGEYMVIHGACGDDMDELPVRQGIDTTSEMVGYLRVGDRIRALDVRENQHGHLRLKLSTECLDGWTTVRANTSEGEVYLEPVENQAQRMQRLQEQLEQARQRREVTSPFR